MKNVELFLKNNRKFLVSFLILDLVITLLYLNLYKLSINSPLNIMKIIGLDLSKDSSYLEFVFLLYNLSITIFLSLSIFIFSFRIGGACVLLREPKSKFIYKSLFISNYLIICFFGLKFLIIFTFFGLSGDFIFNIKYIFACIIYILTLLFITNFSVFLFINNTVLILVLFGVITLKILFFPVSILNNASIIKIVLLLICNMFIYILIKIRLCKKTSFELEKIY